MISDYKHCQHGQVTLSANYRVTSSRVSALLANHDFPAWVEWGSIQADILWHIMAVQSHQTVGGGCQYILILNLNLYPSAC